MPASVVKHLADVAPDGKNVYFVFELFVFCIEMPGFRTSNPRFCIENVLDFAGLEVHKAGWRDSAFIEYVPRVFETVFETVFSMDSGSKMRPFQSKFAVVS